MSERNLAEEARNPADLEEEGLPGLQRLWDGIFGSVVRLCQDAVCGDNARLAPSAGDVADENGTGVVP